MNKPVLYATLPFLLLAAGAAAQEKTAAPKDAPTPLKLDVVFTRYQGDKKVGSVPYTLSLNADGRPTQLRMGIQVPLAYTGKETAGSVVYKTVGNNVDCSAEPLEEGRYRVACSLEQSSLYSLEGEQKATWIGGGSGSAVTAPLIRSFSSQASLLLRDGQTAQYTMATDPVSGDVLKVDITLKVVK